MKGVSPIETIIYVVKHIPQPTLIIAGYQWWQVLIVISVALIVARLFNFSVKTIFWIVVVFAAVALVIKFI